MPLGSNIGLLLTCMTMCCHTLCINIIVQSPCTLLVLTAPHGYVQEADSNIEFPVCNAYAFHISAAGLVPRTRWKLLRSIVTTSTSPVYRTQQCI